MQQSCLKRSEHVLQPRSAKQPINLVAERLQYFSIQGGRAPAVWMDAITRFGSPSDAAYFENREPLRDERQDPIGKVDLSQDRVEFLHPPGLFIRTKQRHCRRERVIKCWYGARDDVDQRLDRRDHDKTVPQTAA